MDRHGRRKGCDLHARLDKFLARMLALMEENRKNLGLTHDHAAGATMAALLEYATTHDAMDRVISVMEAALRAQGVPDQDLVTPDGIVKIQMPLQVFGVPDPNPPAIASFEDGAPIPFAVTPELIERMRGRPKAYFYAEVDRVTGMLRLGNEAPDQPW